MLSTISARLQPNMGQYDQAISYYLRALDLRRSMDDPRGSAIESYSLGTLFDYQGRFGAAINSRQEALKTFRDHQGQDLLDGQGAGWYRKGAHPRGTRRRGEELLWTRHSASRGELKNDGMAAETLGFQGDAYFYRGDFKSAHASYAEALQAATRSKEPDTVLIAKANLAKVQVQEKRTQEAISSLRQLVQQADDLGLKYISVECSIIHGGSHDAKP